MPAKLVRDLARDEDDPCINFTVLFRVRGQQFSTALICCISNKMNLLVCLRWEGDYANGIGYHQYGLDGRLFSRQERAAVLTY